MKTMPFVILLTCFALSSTSVQATTNYWDINGETAGAGGATPSGTWDTGTTANWSTDSVGAIATTNWTDNDDAVFSAGSDATGTFTIDVGGTPVVGNLTVEEGTITISGGTALNVGGGIALKGNIDVYANSTLTISSVITGGDDTGSITKGISGGTGTGTLVLNGDNTYTGQTTVRVGTLSFDSVGDVNGGASALGNPVDAALGALKLGGGTVGATLTYTGAGHSTDRDINLATTTGTTTIDASGSGALVFTSTNGVMVGVNGIKKLLLTGTSTAENKITGTIVDSPGGQRTTLEKTGVGTWVLTGENTFSGVCDIRDGTLIINSIADRYTASSVGTGAAGTAHAIVGLGGFGSTDATLKYTGSGHSSNREFRLWGANTNGGGAIDASGTGPLVLSGNITRPPADIYDKVFTLKGTNTETNTVSGQISDSLNNAKKTFVTKEGVGKWVLTGANTYSGSTTIRAGTLVLDASGSISNSPVLDVQASAIFDVSSVTGGFVLGAAQTLKGNGTIQGNVTANGTLSPGASVGTLTFNSDLILSGNLFIEVDKSLSPSNDVVTVSGTLTNAGAGTVTVTNLGPALAEGDSFQLFNKPVLNGEALTIVSSGSEVWTNKLAVDGSIAVVPTSPPTAPATNLTIVAVGPTSFNLTAFGAADSAYDVYASTNITLPMASWWVIGTTNSDGNGAIQFLDSQATNDQRFYRFGQ